MLARVNGVALVGVESVYLFGKRRKKKAMMIALAVVQSNSEFGGQLDALVGNGLACSLENLRTHLRT